MTSELPWPLNNGGHIRTYHLSRALARDFDVRLMAGSHHPDDPGVEALGAEGVDVGAVHLPPRNIVREAWRAIRADLGGRPYVLYGRHDRPEMWRALEQELLRRPPDVFYMDHLDSFLFARLVPGVPMVVDCHNVCSLLVRRQAFEGHRGLARQYVLREARLLARLERHVSHTPQMLFTVSADDGRVFSAFGGLTPKVIPNGVDCAFYRDLPLHRPPGALLVLYIGTMAWAPNANAAVYLARDFLPRLRQDIPEARLRIVGRRPPPSVMELGRLPGVEVAGDVPDVRPHLRAAHVLVVPLETGGGSRLKILEAFAAGVPVVSTRVGCEGLEVSNGKELLIERREEFPKAVAGLLRNPALAAQLASEARRLAAARYDWNAIGERACVVVHELLGQPHDGRQH